MLAENYDSAEDFLLDDTFAEWAKGASDEADSFWSSYLEKFPEKADAMNQARDIVLSFKIKSAPKLSSQEVHQIIKQVKHKNSIYAPNAPVKLNYWNMYGLRVAAVFLIFSLSAWYFYTGNFFKINKAPQVAANPYKEVVNRTSKNMLLKLADNSSVILSPLAKLKYPVHFSEKKREVWLLGEAFFEISKNAKRPFFVYSNELTIRVVGTSFSVKAGNKDALYRVAVSTGKVAVCAKKANGLKSTDCQSIVLDPNQQAVFYRNKFRLEKATLKQPLLLSNESTQVHFKFEKAPFSKVVAAIRNAYGINVIYNEKVMGGCLLTASLTGLRLEERLDLICKAVEAVYEIKDGNIIISGKGCNVSL